MRHVIWDWNGTLFQDLDITVESVNEALAIVGAGPIDAGRYRDHYTRPVQRFYETVLGGELRPVEWQRIDAAFHAAYRRRIAAARLTPDAAAALGAVRAAGATQSLLSMWRHDDLIGFVTPLGVAAFMERIDGNRDDAGGTKTAHLRRHVAALAAAGVGPGLVIGDALDDAAAAAAVGVACVLYDGGSHHRSELDAAGVPVAPTLIAALTLGGVIPQRKSPSSTATATAAVNGTPPSTPVRRTS